MNHRGKKQGSAYQIDKAPLLEIPIAIPEDVDLFKNLVDQIMGLKLKGQSSTEIEAKLDVLIYELYGLTDSEITEIEALFS